jgi:hypothetical protein
MDKERIKEILKESIGYNKLGKEVTHPSQILIIMRGVP